MVTGTAGSVTARAYPHASDGMCAACSRLSTATSIDCTQILAPCETGHVIERPAIGSRMMSLLNADSAPFGAGGRTTTPGKRIARASTKLRRA